MAIRHLRNAYSVLFPLRITEFILYSELIYKAMYAISLVFIIAAFAFYPIPIEVEN